MSHPGKLMPNLDKNSTKLLNLTVLQRMDPHIEEILMTATHVTFYEFNIDLNQWSRKDVEGSLFVVKRSTQPRFQFVVMNRRNTENLVEDLLGDFEYEVQLPYLLYRNATQEVNGIWFYNQRECEEVASLFNRILSAYSKVPPKANVSSNKSEFEELEAVPTTAVIEGPLEPSLARPSTVDALEDSSFLNFFNTAINIGHNGPGIANSGQPYHAPVPPLPLHAAASVITTHPTPAMQVPSSFPPPISSAPPRSFNGNQGLINNNRIANLVKPSSFVPQPPFTTSSSSLVAPPQPMSSPLPHAAFHHVPNMERPHGAPLLQPFPPPAPPLSLTPSSTSLNNATISRDSVRNALLALAEENQFIDMFYQALLKVHQS
ncbi:mRNA-decapping enzyme-like protein isoform X2 [Impatiens glandulifera]|uniref:mRNA-decapping enzyme-like protein isoform X2 n=1 Tax=Impatiens glandulifera TaxID=253017 RepID=UPI001FB14B9F|nr:mRNA-decapping enzyme-like protein isoform X2 [Impatiens glandulifera]